MISRRTEKILACLLALGRLGFCAYRAVHQSITVDEAFTYNRFIHGPWRKLVEQYDANNHVLHSILVRLSTHLFGLSEFSVRFPSLISGFFLILGSFWVLLRISSPWIRWITIVALSLHPLLLDFSVAARGYSMGLAFLIWAVYFCMERRYVLTGALLGLGISANLTIAFPTLALMFAVLILEDDSAIRRVRAVVSIAAPAVILFALICYAPMRTATRANFYIGYPTIREWLSNLAYFSIRVTDRTGVFGTDEGARVLQWVLLPVVAVYMVITAVTGFRRKPEDRLALVPLVTLITSFFGLIAAHKLLGLNYPMERTGLYFIPLFGFAWAFAADHIESKALARTQALIACLLILQFATQLQTDYFIEWRFDMDAKHVARMLQKASQGKADQSVTVSSAWAHQPALEFYREDLHIAALKPIEWQDGVALYGFDYYVFQDRNPADVEKNNLRVLFADRWWGIVLADRPGGH